MPLSPLARRYDQFILDLDGCVWVGGEPTPRAQEAIAALREAGKSVAFASTRGGQSDLYVLEISDCEVRRVTVTNNGPSEWSSSVSILAQ